MPELSDLPHVARITFQLVLAALVGGVLGFEREQKGKAAGLRTHMLVALGMTVGLGLEILAVVCTVLALVILAVLPAVERRLEKD